jgi:uncharacterized protein
MTALPVTLFFVGLFAVIQIPVTVMVGYRRVQTGIQFFDGGDQTLLRRMRAHANFTETVPITLLAMGAAELAGAPLWLLWGGGLFLLTGRFLHLVTLVRVGWGHGRAVGMVLTLITMGGFGLFAMARVLPM